MLGAELAKGITPLDFSLRSTLHSQLGIETQTNASFKLDWRQSRGNATTLTTFQKCVGCVRAKIGMQMIGKLLLLWMAIKRELDFLCVEVKLQPEAMFFLVWWSQREDLRGRDDKSVLGSSCIAPPIAAVAGHILVCCHCSSLIFGLRNMLTEVPSVSRICTATKPQHDLPVNDCSFEWKIWTNQNYRSQAFSATMSSSACSAVAMVGIAPLGASP